MADTKFNLLLARISFHGFRQTLTHIDLQNYRWPAEWEQHAATWLVWPVNPATWPGIFDRIPAAFATFVATIARFEPVNVLLSTKQQQTARQLTEAACEAAASTFDVTFIDIPVNDSWIRDYGPIAMNRKSDVESGPSQVFVNWDFNSWGGKYPPWTDDAAVSQRMAERQSVPEIRPNVILEGGAIDGNGAGALLTTTSCLLNPNRSSLSKQKMEDVLKHYLQVSSVIWLPGDGIIGDDTDGHIDQLARFISETEVLVATAWSDDAPEAASLRASFDAVRTTEISGKALHPVSLPLPPPRHLDGHRLPASYCNFLICNTGVIVPTFGVESSDEMALQILQNSFPQHQIVGVPAIDLVWGLGAFHCLSRDVPQSVRFD